jgi:AraC-like DNA-binding protein
MVKEVAYECGYESNSYFNRQFQEKYQAGIKHGK